MELDRYIDTKLNTNNLLEAAVETAYKAREVIAPGVPVKTGALQESWRSSPVQRELNGASIGSNLPYAAIVEYRTQYITGKILVLADLFIRAIQQRLK